MTDTPKIFVLNSMISENLTRIFYDIQADLLQEFSTLDQVKLGEVLNKVGQRYADKFFGSWWGSDDILYSVIERLKEVPEMMKVSKEYISSTDISEEEFFEEKLAGWLETHEDFKTLAGEVATFCEVNFDPTLGITWHIIQYALDDYVEEINSLKGKFILGIEEELRKVKEIEAT